MRWIATLFLVLALAGSAWAGEIVLTNGSRLAGELASEVLLFSTGSEIIEIVPDQVAVLTRDELRLTDGRVLRGTVVGGRLKTRTALGELAINVEELQVFRADRVAAPEPTPAGSPRPAAEPVSVAVARSTDTSKGPTQVVEGAKQIGRGVREAATGVGRTVTEGADRIHDGVKAVGEAIWDAMRGVGRTFQDVFGGSAKRS